MLFYTVTYFKIKTNIPSPFKKIERIGGTSWFIKDKYLDRQFKKSYLYMSVGTKYQNKCFKTTLELQVKVYLNILSCKVFYRFKFPALFVVRYRKQKTHTPNQ